MVEATAPLQVQGLPRFEHSTTRILSRDSLPLNFLGMCPISLLPVDADGGKLLSNILIDG